ncbi:phage tailspike protein [Salmonella enterica]|uniref:phage tailspike protein n=1 Tax=Salmonella enterica TaxID=28901 RepID=UPI0009AAD7A4|nr:phage tailspike protein [Salmonella enterica]
MSDITANVVVSMPSQIFTMARSFKAVANGKIYIGKIDTDPVNPANQIPVYLENEDGSHVQVSQPLIINAGGYPVYNGQIAKFVTVQGHSMAVYDAYGTQQFYYPNVLKYDPDQFKQELESDNAASKIGTAEGITVQDFINNTNASINNINEFILNADAANYSTRNIGKLSYVDYQVHTRGSIKVCFQGDSMTAGFDQTSSDIVPPDHGDYATHASMTYPQRFTDFLSQQSGCTVVPTWRAYSGFTAKMAYEKPDWQSNPNVDVFILMYGLNDIGLSTIDEYLDYMQRLIRRFVDWGSGVVVCLPSVGGQGSQSYLAQIWARRMAMVAQAYGCAVFDANEVSYNRNNGSIQSDAVHFNSMGYAIHGEKLASMFMAGGILPTYKPLSDEMTMWPGRVDNSIGYCDAKGNVNLGRSDGTYVRSKIVGELPALKASLMTFSFYLDSDAAHIFIKGSGPLNIIMNNGIWWNNNAQDYYALSLSQDISYAMQRQSYGATGYNDLPGEFPNYKGERKFIGRIMGKGWHTITIFNAQDGGSTVSGYVNAIVVQPVPIGYSIQKYNSGEEKRIISVQSIKIPSPYGQASVPSGSALNSFYLKMPQSLMPTATSNPATNDITPFSYNSGHAYLKISNTSGDYIEYLLIKTISGNYSITCKLLKSTLSNTPTVSASVKKRATSIIKVQSANGTNQPIENIYDSDGAYSDPNESPNAAGGLYLFFEFTWPSGSPSSYWNVEMEYSDLFGSSEVFVGR